MRGLSWMDTLLFHSFIAIFLFSRWFYDISHDNTVDNNVETEKLGPNRFAQPIEGVHEGTLFYLVTRYSYSVLSANFNDMSHDNIEKASKKIGPHRFYVPFRALMVAILE